VRDDAPLDDLDALDDVVVGLDGDERLFAGDDCDSQHGRDMHLSAAGACPRRAAYRLRTHVRGRGPPAWDNGPLVRITTWNVNSIKMRLARTRALLVRHEPDVLCLQELKVTEEAFPSAEFEAVGYRSAVLGQAGRNGVAILSRRPLTDVTCGFPGDPAPEQARVVSGTVDGVRLVNVYVVNGVAVGAPQYELKLRWLDAFTAWLRSTYGPAERLVVAGDFNVTPADVDVHNPQRWRGRNLASEPERARLRALQAWGLVDLTRLHHPGPGPFTFWDYRAGAFDRGWGLRLDLVLATSPVAERCTGVWVDRDERSATSGEGKPSDHAPLTVDLHERRSASGSEREIRRSPGQRRSASGSERPGSAVAVPRVVEPGGDLGVHLLRRCQREPHVDRLVREALCGKEPPARLLTVEAQAEIDAALRRGLHDRELPSRGVERHVPLAGGHLGLGMPCAHDGEHGVQHGPEVLPVGVLAVDELGVALLQEVGPAEVLHHEEGLGIAGDPVLIEPATKRGLVRRRLRTDALRPGSDALSGLLLQPCGVLRPHPLPGPRFGHAAPPVARLSDDPRPLRGRDVIRRRRLPSAGA
jgi:exodeoxyribonuclease III